MVIIGITGGIGHGKSTLAEAFRRLQPRSLHLESFAIIAEVIDLWHTRTTKVPNPHKLDQLNDWVGLLPNILSGIFQQHIGEDAMRFGVEDITKAPNLYAKLFEHIENLRKHPELLTTPITDANKEQFRPILQWLGGYVTLKIDGGIWYRELMRRAQQAAAEGTLLCTIGGVRFPSDAEVIKQGGGYVLFINRPLMSEADIGDPTERERSKIKPDITLVNDGDLTELLYCARQIYSDILYGRLRARYVASEMEPTLQNS